MRISMLSLLCAILLIIAVMNMIGWIFHIPSLIQIAPAFVGMVFNTALLFVITVILILIHSRDSLAKIPVLSGIISLTIIIFSILTISQDMFNYQLNIDNLFVTSWLIDPNPTPGRMAPNTCVAFIICGLIGLLLPLASRAGVAILIQLLAFALFLIATTGLIIYSLKLEFILTWYNYTRMALPTAICFFITSILWWNLFSKCAWYQDFYNRQDRKLILNTSILLVSLTLVSGMVSFAVFTYKSTQWLQKSFQNLLENDVNTFTQAINDAQVKVISASHAPDVKDAIQVVNSHAIDTNALNTLFTLLDFSAAQLEDKNGQPIFKFGKFLQSAKLQVPLKTVNNPILLWSNDYWLRMKVPMMLASNKIVGYLIVELPLTNFNRLYNNYQALGATGEVRICAPYSQTGVICFPSRNQSDVKIVPYLLNGKTIPMFYALRGEKGTMYALDLHKHKVITTYGPVSNLGIGMAVKMDTKEIYQPINDLLTYMLFLGSLFIMGALLLLQRQVVPLIKKVVESEQETNKIKLELEKSENRYEMAISGSRTGIWDWEVGNDEVYYSEHFLQLLGYSAMEFPPYFSSLENVVHPDDHDKMIKTIKEHLENNKDYNDEYKLRIKSGEYKWFQAIGKTYLDENNKLHMSGSLNDINERKEVDTLKQQFISIVSHELRTPLTSIYGSLSILAGFSDNSDKAAQLLKIAKNNTERLIRLINDILDVEKIAAGKMTFNIQSFNLIELINESITQNQGFAEKFNVQIQFRPPCQNLMIKSDYDRLMQVMTNLLSNAIKFSAKNAAVIVVLQIINHNRVKISITDKGKGIPKEFEAHIFGKFSQADAPLTRQYQGSGLGLNITKSIVEHLGGTIGFATQVNQGTTFFFEIDLESNHLTTSQKSRVLQD